MYARLVYPPRGSTRFYTDAAFPMLHARRATPCAAHREIL